MAKHYKTGTREEVIRNMAYYAIRDQEALIDAHTPQFGEPDEMAKEVIQDCKDNIEDFRRLAISLSRNMGTKP